MPDDRYAALAREFVGYWWPDLPGRHNVAPPLAALLTRVAGEARADADETPCDNCAQRRAWLDAVSGALLDAGATVGDENTYADAVRRLIPEVCAVARAQERVRIVREMGHLADPPLDPVEYFRREFKPAGAGGGPAGGAAGRGGGGVCAGRGPPPAPPLDPVEYFRREFKRAGEVGRAEGVLAERERCAKV